MTDEQYTRAVQINNRIKELEKVKEYIKQKTKHRLWYAYNTGEFGSSWSLCPEWCMRNIGDILDKHDLMIRQEIEEEIEKLKAEIKEL